MGENIYLCYNSEIKSTVFFKFMNLKSDLCVTAKKLKAKKSLNQNSFSGTASLSTRVLNLWNHQLASPKESNYFALLRLDISFNASNTFIKDKIMGHTVFFNKLPLT